MYWQVAGALRNDVKAHFTHSEGLRNDAKAYFTHSEELRNDAKTHFTHSETLRSAPKTLFCHSEVLRRIAKAYWQSNDTEGNVENASFNAISRLQQTIIRSELLAEHNAEKRHPEYLEVEPPRTVLQIVQIVTQPAEHLLHRVGIAVVERGIGGDSRTYLIEKTVTGIVLHNLINVELAFRTGTDECHIAPKDVPQLWKFVQMVFAQELADFGQTGIHSSCIELRTCRFGIDAHAAELVDVKRTAEATDAFLLENGRTSVLALHCDIAYQKQRRKYNQRDACNDAVPNTLHAAFKIVHPIGNKFCVLIPHTNVSL